MRQAKVPPATKTSVRNAPFWHLFRDPPADVLLLLLSFFFFFVSGRQEDTVNYLLIHSISLLKQTSLSAVAIKWSGMCSLVVMAELRGGFHSLRSGSRMKCFFFFFLIPLPPFSTPRPGVFFFLCQDHRKNAEIQRCFAATIKPCGQKHRNLIRLDKLQLKAFSNRPNSPNMYSSIVFRL